MIEIRRFWLHWLAWATALTALAFAAGGAPEAGQAIRWVASAMALAAYPAGLLGRDLLRWRDPPLASLARLVAATGAVAMLVFAVRAWVGPALSSPTAGEPITLSLAARVDAWQVATDVARRSGSLADWAAANRIGWEVQTNVTMALTCLGFAWIGVLLGRWVESLFRREVRLGLYAGGGLFLLLTGYLMSENAYEQLLVRTVGPADVTAWFPLLSPGMLTVGLLIPTAARLLRDRDPGAGVG